MSAPLRRVRHKIRGSNYEVLGQAEVQISSSMLIAGDQVKNASELHEGDELVVYRCLETGKLWARFHDEFEDGRFEEIVQ